MYHTLHKVLASVNTSYCNTCVWHKLSSGGTFSYPEGQKSGLVSRHSASKSVRNIHTLFLYTALKTPSSGRKKKFFGRKEW